MSIVPNYRCCRNYQTAFGNCVHWTKWKWMDMFTTSDMSIGRLIIIRSIDMSSVSIVPNYRCTVCPLCPMCPLCPLCQFCPMCPLCPMYLMDSIIISDDPFAKSVKLSKQTVNCALYCFHRLEMFRLTCLNMCNFYSLRPLSHWANGRPKDYSARPKSCYVRINLRRFDNSEN